MKPHIKFVVYLPGFGLWEVEPMPDLKANHKRFGMLWHLAYMHTDKLNNLY